MYPIDQEESDNEFDKPVSKLVQTGSKHKHSGHNNSQYVTTSDLGKADNEESDTGYNDTDVHLTQMVKKHCVTATVHLLFFTF